MGILFCIYSFSENMKAKVTSKSKGVTTPWFIRPVQSRQTKTGNAMIKKTKKVTKAKQC